jgi:hypothetical protein
MAAKSAEPSATRPQPPPLPPPPIEFFRQLLTMKPEEREKALALREPKTREIVKAKVRQFEGLPPDERENRLRTLELRWYLLPLMKASPTNRSARLQTIPAPDRQLVEKRLQDWDRLPADAQQNLLESELAVVFMRPERGVISHAGPSMVTTQQQQRITESIKYLNGLPTEKRREVYRTFESFFELSQHERAKALDSFTEAERKQMERSLRLFDNLAPADRDLCLEGFEKFRALSEQERQEFLRSAERWQTMSANDRALWRSLVNRKAIPLPPMPPGLSGSAAKGNSKSPELATNSVR